MSAVPSDWRARWIPRLILASCATTLLALAAMVWSILVPRPVPVMFAMSVGQGLGGLSLLGYLAAVLLDLRRKRVLGGDDEEPR